MNFSLLPPDANAWPDSSREKLFLLYMVQNNKFFVYPRTSLTTNFGDIGTHFNKSKKTYQVSLLNRKMTFRFCRFSDSLAVYDSFLEIIPESIQQLNPTLSKFDFEVDLYGNKVKGQIEKEFILTSKDSSQSIASFARELKHS